MDWDKALVIVTIWLIVGAAAFVAEWAAIIPAVCAFAGTVAIVQS